MITTVNRQMFCEELRDVGPENFSRPGLHALFDHFEEYEDGTGEQIEFDPIAICCEYSEYGSISEYNRDYGSEITSLDELEDITTVIRLEACNQASIGFIVQDH